MSSGADMFAKYKFRLALMMLFAAMAAQSFGQSAKVPGDVKVGARLLYILANEERAQRGLQPLHWDGKLAAAAAFHAGEMARREGISHQFPGEPDVTARAAGAGAHFSAVAENVAIVSEIQSAHTEWMKSPGHRANLLDPMMDSVGIAFEMRDGQFYVVQDFSRNTASLSYAQQEQRVAQLIQQRGITVARGDAAVRAARQTCAMSTGWAGGVRPSFTMRWTSSDLGTLPDALGQQLDGGRFASAWVGACAAEGIGGFSTYSLAVMLFTKPQN